MKDNLKYIEKKIIPVLKRNDVEFAAVFGSYARGEAKKGSDVDILVKFSIPISLLKLIHVENELSDTLRKKVDLLTVAGVHPYIKQNVYNDLKVLYGKRPNLGIR